MTVSVAELEALRQRNEELERLLGERRRIDTLRRALRGCETVEDVASRGAAFASMELDGAPCAILLEDLSRSTFAVQATAGLPESEALDEVVVERCDALTEALAERATIAHSSEATIESLLALADAMNAPRLVAHGLYDGVELVGLLVVATHAAVHERLVETAAELSSATAASIRARSRAEELAMLEIQERELVGLLREIEKRDASIREDLEQARSFQTRMMTLPAIRGAHVVAFYEPLGLVGGDLYALSQTANRIRVFLADATGHGVRASLTTMFIKSGYESLKHLPDPASLLRELNESIASTYRSNEMLFSAMCVDVRTDTGDVTLAFAGHPPACMVRAGEIAILEGSGALMGVRGGMRYTNVATSFGPGDGLYLFTDGIADARSENGDYFGEDRLFRIIRESHLRGDDVAEDVRRAVRSFAGSRELTDDISFVGLRLDAPRQDDSI